MTAKIIRLERFNAGCRHHANGVRFPHLYRVTGFEFDLAGDELVPGVTTPVEPFYTLSDQGNFGIANPTFVPLKALVPELDAGWMIVRHHGSHARAETYIDCVGDSRPIPYEDSMPMLWQREDGVFTLMRRPPTPGRLDHLIAYITKVPAEGFPDIAEDAFHIVHPDGRVSMDPELLFPSDGEVPRGDEGL
jgi:hypothetical protein